MQPEEYAKLDDKEKVGAEKPTGVDDPKFEEKAASARKEGEQLAQRIGDSGGLSSSDNSGGSLQGKVSGLLKARRTYVIGVAAGGLMAALLGLFFAFLAPFKLSFMKENVDAKRMSRLLYLLDQRSDRFLVTMMKAEIAGEQDGKNRYFEAKGWYDSPNSFTQWYKDIRTDKFFDDMAEKQGIRFARETSGAGQDKLVRLKSVDVRGEKIDFSDLKFDGGTQRYEALVEERFSSNKYARRAFNAALKEQTKSWQVIKRYNMRKWGYERLGITKWRFFEGTREKADAAVKKRWTKLVTKPILSGRFSRCIFGKPDDCPKTSNPNDERNSFANETPDGRLEEALDESTDEVANNPDAPETPGEKSAGKVTKIFASKAIQKLVPFVNAASYVDTAKQINYLLGPDEGLIKLVAVMRAAEYSSAYFTFGTITDHLKEGAKVSPEEVNGVMKMTEGIERSGAYQDVIGYKEKPSPFNNKAFAQNNNTNDTKEPFDAVTEEMKVNSDGTRAADITKYYQDSIGPVASEFFKFYNGSFLDKAISFVLNLIDSVVGELTNAGKWVFGKLTGVDVDKLFESFTEKIMAFLGGSPLCAGDEGGPRIMNCIDAGANVVAEALTQTMGGGLLSAADLSKLDQAASLAKYEQDQDKSTFKKLTSLDDPNSLAAKVVMNTPTSYEDAFAGSAHAIASIFPQNLSKTLANLPSTLSKLGTGPALAAQEKSIWGVDAYGLTEEQLNAEPFDSKSDQQCQQEIDEYTAQMKEGKNPPSSICLFDSAVSNSLKCMYTTDEECAKVGEADTADTGDSGGSIGNLELPPNLGDPNPQGYYQMPEARNGEYIFDPTACPNNRWGSKELIAVIYTVAKAWHEKYPEDPVKIGDLNGPLSEHSSHRWGVGVDINVHGKNFWAADMLGGSYSKEKTVEFGKMFLQTDMLLGAWYNDGSVNSVLNNYSKDQNLSNSRGFQPWPRHEDHFHIDIKRKRLPEWTPSC